MRVVRELERLREGALRGTQRFFGLDLFDELFERLRQRFSDGAPIELRVDRFVSPETRSMSTSCGWNSKSRYSSWLARNSA